MKIVIKATNLKLDKELQQYIEEKLNSLEKFFKNVYNIKTWVEVGKTTLHHQKGKIFRAEIQIRLPNKSLRAEAVSATLKPAIDEVKDELQKQIKKYKEKFSH